MKSLYAIAVGVTVSIASPAPSQGIVASPSDARTRMSSDVAALVEAAYPRYEDSLLTSRLADVARKLQARADRISVRAMTGIERLLQLQPVAGTRQEVDTPLAYYRIEPLSGKAFGHVKNETYLGLDKAHFASIKLKVQEGQNRFLAQLGIPSDEVIKTSFHKVMVQGTLEGSPDNSDGTPALVRRGMTLAQRGFAGFPLDGNHVRISSYNERRVQTFSLNWPRFKLHPEVTAVAIKSAADMKAAIVRDIKAQVPAGDTIGLSMGVVFQPVHTLQGELVFIPAMKVIVTPKAKEVSDGTTRGTDTPAGVVLYAGLLRAAPRILNEQMNDTE